MSKPKKKGKATRASKRRTRKPVKGQPAAESAEGKGPEPEEVDVDRQKLMEQAYRALSTRLQRDNGKAIDDLVKLLKLEKDLGGEGEDVKEVKVRWESSESEDGSSSEG